MTGIGAPRGAQPPARRVFRVEWVPGTDQLLGRCFCSAELLGTEPGLLWDWLLGHPAGHDPAPATAPPRR